MINPDSPDGSLRLDIAVSPVDKLARKLVFSQLQKMDVGCLTVRDVFGSTQFGTKDSDREVTSVIHVSDLRFYRLTARRGGLGAAEAYFKGYWTSDDLTRTFRTFVRRIGKETQIERTVNWLLSLDLNLKYRFRSNSKVGSKKNIRDHYDLGNDLFETFLDPTMAYSSGIFEHEHSTLEEASIAKFERICQKLSLTPELHLVEIGTGWGGFAIHAAKNYGCRVTTTTISKEQFELAKRRIAAAGVDDLVNIVMSDYRDLVGKYDRLVSIEMVEAVGDRYLEEYFQCCANLLKDDGCMVLQGITMPDQSYSQYLRQIDFIKYFVFPGSCCPSRTALLNAVTKSTDLRMVNLEEIGPHYALTLKKWRENFVQNLEHIRELGYSEEFIRLWEFYLCYCEIGFSERHIGDIQILLSKPKFRGQQYLPGVELTI